MKKISGTETTVYVYDAFGKLAAEYCNATTPAPSPCGTPTCFLTADLLGSTRLLTDSTGEVKRFYDYMPFGEHIFAGVGGRTIEMGYKGEQSGVTQRFTGKERDTETGLDYFLARYYSGAQGRFTSPDPFNPITESADLAEFQDYIGNPQNWNRYSYTRSNPLAFVDPDGRAAVVARAAFIAVRQKWSLRLLG